MVAIDKLKKKYLGAWKVHFLLALLCRASSWKWNRCSGVGYRTAGVSAGNLVSALPLTFRQMTLSNMFVHSFPSKRKLHWYGNNFQTTDSCQRRSEDEHSVLGRTLGYTTQRLEESLQKNCCEKTVCSLVWWTSAKW